MTMKSFRLPDALWTDVVQASNRAGESVTAVVTRALEDYVANPPAEGSQIDAGVLPCTVCGRAVRRKGGGGLVAATHQNQAGKYCEGSGV